MKSIQLKLETVTPMFLRGQDNQTPELRPPPFKALFRYWWRAVVGEMDPNELRDREGDLFGNTKKRSPLSVRIPGQASLPSGGCALLPHRPHVVAPAYLPNNKFNLTLIASILSKYERIAEIGFLLGGVGNRSRRGFGSIRYQDWSFHTVEALQDKVFATLDGISPGRFDTPGSKIQVAPTIRLPDYPVIQAIYFGANLWPNVDDLLHRIGQETHKHSGRALGGISPRMASPIHVRIQKVGDQFVPVVTQLNSVFPSPTPPHGYPWKQRNFIAAILA